MCSQDLRPLACANTETLALFLNAKGRLIDEVRLASAAHAQDGLMLHTAPHRAQALATWLSGYTIMDDVSYEVVSEAAAVFTVLHEDVHGAAFAAIQQSLGFAPLPTLGTVVRATAVHAWVMAPRRALKGGVVIVAPDAAAQALVADALVAAFGPSASERAWQERLIRAGVVTAQLDYPTPAAPFELRLGQDSIHWHKGCYIGQEIISRLEAYDKVARLMMGVMAPDGAQTLQGPANALRLLHQGSPVGKVMRYVPDATGLGLVGLAMVKREAARPLDVQLVDDAGHTVAGTLFDCPQWQP
jgi:folate-binding protein YgfZ